MDIDDIFRTKDINIDFKKLFLRGYPNGEIMDFFLKNAHKVLLNNLLSKPINAEEETPLLYYCKIGDYETALNILKYDTKFDIFNKTEKNTPLLETVGKEDINSLKVAKILVRGNCLPNHINAEGQTVVIRAAKYSTDYSIKIINLVLDLPEFSEPFFIDKSGKSALDWLLDEVQIVDEKEDFIKLIIRFVRMYNRIGLLGKKYQDNFQNCIERICQFEENLKRKFKIRLKLQKLCLEPAIGETGPPMAKDAMFTTESPEVKDEAIEIPIGVPVESEFSDPNYHYVLDNSRYQLVPQITKNLGGKFTRKIYRKYKNK